MEQNTKNNKKCYENSINRNNSADTGSEDNSEENSSGHSMNDSLGHSVDNSVGYTSVNNVDNNNTLTASRTNKMLLVISVLLCIVSVGVYRGLSASQEHGMNNSDILKFIKILEKQGFYSKSQTPRDGQYGSLGLLNHSMKYELSSRIIEKYSIKEKIVTNKKSSEKKTEEFMTIHLNPQSQEKSDKEEQFVIVFDAGSTGTRVHIYKFSFKDNGLSVQLADQWYKWIKPGLSDFVLKPDEVGKYLQPLVDAAVTSVPQAHHSQSLLIFKATAGLRLLDAGGAEMLLGKVRESLALTDFLFDPADVNILGGREEGIFGWITVNYLLGYLNGKSPTAAALDLGGGSMQITYVPHDKNKFNGKFDHVELFGHVFDLYTYSYLGQGLKAARNTSLWEEKGVLHSKCLPLGYRGLFLYEGINLLVQGPTSDGSSGECWGQVGRFLADSAVSPAWDLVSDPHQPGVYLFSYFYGVLQGAGLIKSTEKEKVLSIQDIFAVAYKACHLETYDSHHPFACQDLTYIVRLLGEGFMLWDTPLHMVEEIRNGQVSWALGAALAALDSWLDNQNT